MNEYNHHRIIERVALDRNLDASVKKIFMKASDFTDSILAKSDYFFYRNYYTIKAESHTILLNRVDSNGYIVSNKSKYSINNSGEKLLNGMYSLGEDWSHWTDEKEFFSAVNERCKSAHFDKLDTGNQSDNVAFLHAMGAVGETAGDTIKTTEDNSKTSRSIFEDHIKKCFAEYLFLEDEEKALFILGIAFHGIMDSFTPSHMGFQKYTEQDMGLHAQGDVIPIMGDFDEDGALLKGNISKKEDVLFNPGQYSKEKGITKPFKRWFIRSDKYYDGNAIVNPVEYIMLRIFFHISDIRVNYGNGWNGVGDIDEFWKTFKGCTLKQINEIIGKGKYRYGPKSYAYSEAAIRVISDIYKYLSKKREECKNYSEYKNNKQEIVNNALDIWIKVYGKDDEDGKDEKKDEDINVVFLFDNKKESYSMKTLRKEHIGLSLYYKDPGLEDWKVQQDIDKLNRLKG